MSTTWAYTNIVWRVQWSEEITKDVVSNDNPKGKITNSDLEMASFLLLWIVREDISPITHETTLGRRDSTTACSWETRMSPKSNVAARLARALALWQRICQAGPLVMLNVPGEDNYITDITSRSFTDNDRWFFPSNTYFIKLFAKQFPLPQGVYWQMYQPSRKIVTRVTSKFWMKQLPMDI